LAACGKALARNRALTFTLAKTSPKIRELVRASGISHRVRYDPRSYGPTEMARRLSTHCGVVTDQPILALRASGLGLPVVTLDGAGGLLPLDRLAADNEERATKLIARIDSDDAVSAARASGAAVRSSCRWDLVAGRILARLPSSLVAGATGASAPVLASSPVAMARRRPRIGLMHDGATWAFSRIAGQMKRQLSPWADVVVGSLAAPLNPDGLDAVVLIWWKAIHAVCSRLPTKTRVYPCLYDYFTWTGWRQRNHLSNLVARSGGLIFSSCDDLSQRLLREKVAREAVTLTDGVDVSMFVALPRPADDGARDLVVGWVGNPRRHGKLKGLGLIRRAVKQVSGVRLVEANALQSPVPFDKMPAFYAGLDAVIVASTSEGTPNPLLEGMSAGRTVLTTAVGVSPMMKSPGVRRITVRTPDGIASALQDLVDNRSKLDEWGAANRREAEESWTWERRMEPFVSRLRSDLSDIPDEPPRSPTSPGKSLIVSGEVQVIERPAGAPPRVLLISDVRDWAFDRNMRDLAESTGKHFDFSSWYVAEYLRDGNVPDMRRFDSVFCVYHRWPVEQHLPWSRTLGSLRGFWFWPENPGPPDGKAIELVNRFKAFHVVTQANYDELKERCPGVVYLTNPVQMGRFPESAPLLDSMVASWNGNAKHAGRDIKGFESIVRPACRAAGVPLEYAEYNTCRLSSSQMPAFYLRASVAVSTSLYEGASNSVMEAMASGLAAVVTDVGNHREMRDSQREHLGDTGIILVDRSPGAVADVLRKLKRDPKRVHEMGKLNRLEIQERWSWKAWADRYAAFIRKAL